MSESPTDTAEFAAFGVNLIGHVSGDFGLAAAARNTIKNLPDMAIDVTVLDVSVGARSGLDDTFAHLIAPPGSPLPWGVNLFHMNPPGIKRLLESKPSGLRIRDRLNVCVPFWELPSLPLLAEWRSTLGAMDMILCPSAFIEDAIRASGIDTPLRRYPQRVWIPHDIRSDRARWNLPPEPLICLVTFDVGSGLERKNPLAAIEAFRLAFGDREDVLLVVKVSGPTNEPQFADDVERLRRTVTGRRNIRLIEATFSHREVLELYAACDILISLHRSEGLGLHLMEAMALEKPVVATGWSGNVDYMRADDSISVDYKLVPVRSAHFDYRPEAIGVDQYWAEPDIEMAGRALALLVSDRGLRSRLAHNASRAMDALQTESPASLASGLRQAWEETDWSDRSHVSSQFRRLSRPAPWTLLRLTVGSALRTVGLRH